PEASPVLLTVATDGVADAQVTRLVMSWKPSVYSPVAVSCSPAPTATARLLGSKLIDFNKAGGTVRVTPGLGIPSSDPVITPVPSFTPTRIPPNFAATSGVAEVQVTESEMSFFEPSG